LRMLAKIPIIFGSNGAWDKPLLPRNGNNGGKMS
jgi:hypothetical protein